MSNLKNKLVKGGTVAAIVICILRSIFNVTVKK